VTMPMLINILKSARARIADKRHWTRGRNALSRDRYPVVPSDPRACYWCARGAVYAETPAWAWDVGEAAIDMLTVAAKAEFHCSMPERVNDRLGHVATLRMFDLAIAQAEAAEAVPA
jgi:hypothetical protein